MGHELTKNDIKKMEEEIEYRIHEVRKAALDDVKETRAQPGTLGVSLLL